MPPGDCWKEGKRQETGDAFLLEHIRKGFLKMKGRNVVAANMRSFAQWYMMEAPGNAAAAVTGLCVTCA